MLNYPNIDPVAFHLGPVAVHWYGLMYLLAFGLCWGLLALRIRRHPLKQPVNSDQLSDLVFYAALGTIVGGRVGYIVFYAWDAFIHSPLILFQIWQGGMSFHGGLLGVLLALGWYAHRIHATLLDLTDFIAPVVPLGLAAGRIGNFINGELWGRVTDVPWGMIFPSGGPEPRHPSQLYEFLLEGILLFIVLWVYTLKPRPRFSVSGLFLIGYGFFRFIVEFYREPDPQVGFVVGGWMTKGQMLSLPMMIAGLVIFIYAYTRPKTCSNI